MQIKNDLLHLWNNPPAELETKLTEPARWCINNLKAVSKIESKTALDKIVEVVKKVVKAIFSAIALIFTMPLALIALGVSRKIDFVKPALPSSYNKNGFEIDHQGSAQQDLATMSKDELNKDWKLLDKIGHVRIINLDKHKDRLKGALDNLKDVGLKADQVERFPAILGNNLPRTKTSRMDNNHRNYDPIKEKDKFENLQKRQTGCFMSHYTVIKEAKAAHDKAKQQFALIDGQIKLAEQSQKTDAEALKKLKSELNIAKGNIRKYSSVLVIEDDSRMGRQTGDFSFTLKHVGVVFRKVMMELSDDYDMFFFAAKELRGCQASGKEWLRKIRDFHDLSCYVVHSRFYDKFLNQLKVIEDDSAGKLIAVDRELPKCFPKTNAKVFLSNPPLAMQGGCVSSITQDGTNDPLLQWHTWRWNYTVRVS